VNRSGRAGATLIEAVVALALVALVGLSGVELARAATRVTDLGKDSERQMQAASDFLNAVSLWSARELDQRLGSREQGAWTLEVQRIVPQLYTVTLRDSTDVDTILSATLFRERGGPDAR
jgi:type II secretory pathway pseudopilin PulG